MSIPIKNIYHMLSYAWNRLEESELVNVTLDGVTTLPDLFARILLNGCHQLFKLGLDQSYVERTEEIAGIKGKLELSQTLKTGVHLRQRTICTFDELSINTLTNQIIRSTLLNLSEMDQLAGSLKTELKRCIKKFVFIERIRLTSRHFSLIQLHRNNGFYKFLLDVCQIIYDNTLPSQQQGRWIFRDFSQDEKKMHKLFQDFVKRFYEVKYRGVYEVKSAQIKWRVEADENSKRFLPRMTTDISLENKVSKIIIETKFYNEAMSHYYNTEKIKSEHFYQLFAYLLHQESDVPKTLTCKGILLYPTVSKEYNLKFAYMKHPISLQTVNLDLDWLAIEERLYEAIQ